MDAEYNRRDADEAESIAVDGALLSIVFFIKKNSRVSCGLFDTDTADTDDMEEVVPARALVRLGKILFNVSKEDACCRDLFDVNDDEVVVGLIELALLPFTVSFNSVEPLVNFKLSINMGS